jgi:3-hydroxybutyryl-CoA dehydratase
MSELAYEDIKIGDEASLTRTITEVHIVNYDKRIIKLRTTAVNQRREMVIDGTAVIKKVGL